MHYKNGREAKNGDPVVMLQHGASVPVVGILYNAVPGVEYCNGRLAQPSMNDPVANLAECLHADDVKAVAYEHLPAPAPKK